MKIRLWIGCIATMLVVLAVYGQGAGQQTSNASAQTLSAHRALIQEYCIYCHTQKTPNGIAMDQLDLSRVNADPARWERVVHKLRAGMMPPSGFPRPDHPTLEALAVWLENELDRNPAAQLPPPGIHRINRAEYSNAIRDLLALDVDATKFLPADDSTRGFDNMAVGLQLSPALLEAYLSAAGKISRLAMGTATAPTQVLFRLPADNTQNYHVEGLPFGTRGGILIRHEFPVDGEYAIKVTPINRGLMGGSQAFGEVRGERLEVLLDGARQGVFDWDKEVAPPRGGGQPGTVDVRIQVNAGEHAVGVAFLATHYAPLQDLNRAFERSTIETGGLPGFTFYPHVGSVRIDGPISATPTTNTASRQKILVCRPAGANDEQACAQRIISTLAAQAFRQPAAAEDLADLVGLYESGRESGGFDQGIGLALQGILAHPKFIYRIEREPAAVAEGQRYPISGLELASRLSYFLWSKGPDEELTNLATQGRLQDPAVLEAQVKRMLADPRSEALCLNFAGQWLKLRNLDASYPDVKTFPDFDNNLRQAMKREIELFFDSIIREDRNVLDLLTADYTFLNERLAKHYGIPNVKGSYFRRVTLGPEFDVRRGLLGKGAVHVTSSLPNRTSLVGRGKWVLVNILGTQPPDPPPFVVPPLADTPGRIMTLRETMELHRKFEPCASCHRIMDPPGLAMENFDAIGTWRTTYAETGTPIEADAVQVDGTPLNGVSDLRKSLLDYSPQIMRNITERLMTYALGRGVEYFDMPALRSIVRDAGRNNNRFSSIVTGIVKSDAFRMNTKVAQSQTPQRAGNE